MDVTTDNQLYVTFASTEEYEVTTSGQEDESWSSSSGSLTVIFPRVDTTADDTTEMSSLSASPETQIYLLSTYTTSDTSEIATESTSTIAEGSTRPTTDQTTTVGITETIEYTTRSRHNSVSTSVNKIMETSAGFHRTSRTEGTTDTPQTETTSEIRLQTSGTTSEIDFTSVTAGESSTSQGEKAPTGLIIGVTVALVVIVIALVVLGVYLLYKRRRRLRSNTPRSRKISSGVKRPDGLVVDRCMIQHPAHVRKDSTIVETLQQNLTQPSGINKDLTKEEFITKAVINTKPTDTVDIRCETGEPSVRSEITRELGIDSSNSDLHPSVKEVHDSGEPEHIEDTKKSTSSVSSDSGSITSSSTNSSVIMDTKANSQSGSVATDSQQTDQGKPGDNNSQQPNGKSESTPSNAAVYQQQDTKSHKTRKLSGPNNQVPKNVLSNWKNKFEGQQTEIFEEEEEEEEEN